MTPCNAREEGRETHLGRGSFAGDDVPLDAWAAVGASLALYDFADCRKDAGKGGGDDETPDWDRHF